MRSTAIVQENNRRQTQRNRLHSATCLLSTELTDLKCLNQSPNDNFQS